MQVGCSAVFHRFILRNALTLIRKPNNVRRFSVTSHKLMYREEPEFHPSMYRNELHVVGTVVSDPSPRYKSFSDPNEDRGDPIGYSFSIEIPSYGRESSVQCSVVSYTFPNRDIADYISSSVCAGVTVEIDGFLRKTMSKSRYDETKSVSFYSIGPTAVRILDETVDSNDHDQL